MARADRPRAGTVLLAALVAGCGDDAISRQRPDSGVATVDSGTSEPLALAPGMRFVYRGQLNYRTRAQGGDSRDAIYDLSVLITAVDDRGALGESTVTITATGARSFQQNWDPSAGVHSWVAGAGPCNDGDQVSAAPTVVALTQAPVEPPLPPQKRLPLDQLFFLDLRRAESLRTAFFDRHTGLGPRFVPPSNDPGGRWVLGLDGDDPTMDFYPDGAKHRTLSLAYDPRGFLVEIRETLGTTAIASAPNGSFTLTMTSMQGP